MSVNRVRNERAGNTKGLDANLARALRHPARIAILRALASRRGGHTLDELSLKTDEPHHAITRHVRILRQIGAIDQVPGPTPPAPQRPSAHERYALAATPLARTLAVMLDAATQSVTHEPAVHDSTAHDDLDIVLSQLPSGVAIYDVHGHLIRQNAAAERIARRRLVAGEPPGDRQHRYSMRDANGRPIREADSPSGRARRGETFDNAEYIIDGQHGPDTHILTSGSPLLDGAGQPQGALLTFTDVTEQRLLEHSERRQRALAETIIDWVPVGIALYDASDEFRCLRHNSAFLALVGPKFRARGSIQNVPLDELFDADSRARVRAIYEQVRATGIPFTIDEFPATLLSDPDPRWYQWSLSPLRDTTGEIYALLNGAVEITALVRVREELRQQAAQLETLIAAMPEAVALADRDGNFILTNAAAEEIWGKSTPGALQTERYAAEFPCYGPDGEPLAAEQLPLPRALTGEIVIGQDLTYLRPDGSKVDLLCNSAPIYDKQNGVIAGGVVVFQDITRMKELERQRDEFLSIAAHELRTPLTTILGTLHVIARQLARDDEKPLDRSVLAQSVNRINRQAERINKLVTDLLDTTRLSAGRLEFSLVPCDLTAIAREAADGQAMVYATSRIVLELPSRPVHVVGDPTRLGQVIENLLTNALKYSDEEHAVELSLTVEHGQAHVRVRDFGVGIPPESIEHLFERFYRVPGTQVQTGSGVGLGLYISRQIVEQHGGEISVESRLGEGATFHVVLPLAT